MRRSYLVDVGVEARMLLRDGARNERTQVEHCSVLSEQRPHCGIAQRA